MLGPEAIKYGGAKGMLGPSPIKDAVRGPKVIVRQPFFTRASSSGFGILIAFQQSYDQADCFSAVIGLEANGCKSAVPG